MRNHLIAASVAALVIGSAAQAETVCHQDNSGRAVATIAGAGIGAILGNVIDGGHNRAAGTIIGGVAGGVAGNQLAKGDVRCDHAYGYYDESGRWHASRIDASAATGYYDRDNRWVDGAPRGYYDDGGRWIAYNGDTNYAGYRDRDGRWIPVGVTGYYASDGEWIQASAPGYYDQGRWVSGPAYGRYDDNGHWIVESNPRGTATAHWAAGSQPGYYDDNGRWVRGQTTGYYDARGRWVSLGMAAGAPAVSNVAYNSRDVRVREARIEERIQRMVDRGELTRRDARHARDELASIRQDEAHMRYSGGRFSEDEQNVIHQRLDQLGATLRANRDDGDHWVG